MAKTRNVGSTVVNSGALGVATHYLKFSVTGGAGAVLAGSVKTGGDNLVASVARPGVGRYTITFNPQHIHAIAGIRVTHSTAAQTDAIITIRPKVQGTDCVLTTSGVQSMEIMCTNSANAPVELPSGTTVFVEITEYTNDAGKKYSVG